MLRFMTNLALKGDVFLNKFPKTKNALCVFFDWSTRFTHVLLFNPLVFSPLLMVIYFVCLSHAGEFHLYVASIHLGGFKMVTYGFSHFLSGELKGALLFCLFLLELTFLNTFLSLFPGIRQYMFNLYGENILKERGYKSPLSSLSQAGLACAGCLAVFAGAEYSNRGAHMDTMINYTDNYQAYLKAKGADAEPPVPVTYTPLAAHVKETVTEALTKAADKKK